MPEPGPCPLCETEMVLWERYPGLICGTCAERARDEHGRRMRFGTDTILGTVFVAEVKEEGEWRRLEGDTATCFVDGRRCVAGEHRFGGHYVRLVD